MFRGWQSRIMIPMKTLLSRLLGLSLLLAALFAQAQQPPRNMEELMRKSGLWNQVASVFSNLRTEAEQARAQAPKGAPGDMDDATFEQLVRAMERAFSADRLRQFIAAEMAKGLSVEDEKTVIAWLDSDVGRRMTALEEARDAAKGNPEERMREVNAYFEIAPKERRDMGIRMVAALDAGESGVDQVVALMTAMVYGMSLADPRFDESAVGKIKAALEAQRPRAAKMFEQLAVLLHTHTYRDVPMAELTRYVEFIESPAGRRYHEATRAALKNAIARASIDLGRYFGESLPKSPKRS